MPGLVSGEEGAVRVDAHPPELVRVSDDAVLSAGGDSHGSVEDCRLVIVAEEVAAACLQFVLVTLVAGAAGGQCRCDVLYNLCSLPTQSLFEVGPEACRCSAEPARF